MNTDLEYCAHCRTRLPKDEWCPVVTETASDGSLLLRSFCDEDCKESWLGDDDE